MTEAPKKIPTIAELLSEREKVLSDIQKWIELGDSIMYWARENGITRFALYDDCESLKKAEKKIDVELWKNLIERSHFLDAMTEKAKSEYLEKIELKPPKFCLSEIEALIENGKRIYENGFDQTIKEVHRQFIGCGYYGGDWRFGKKDNIKKIEHLFRCTGPISW